jgi:TPR repeat protein
VPRDLGQAAALYRQAAEAGDAEGEYRLAALHFDGRGVCTTPLPMGRQAGRQAGRQNLLHGAPTAYGVRGAA